MGVAGCGKSTIARLLADSFGARLLEADDFHSPASIEKMTAGIALTDDDRWPWLRRLQFELANDGPVVLSCSALRRPYRDLLRRATGVQFVFLELEPESALRRLQQRPGHFMGPAMVASQFAALERPVSDETDVVTLNATGPVSTIVDEAVASLRSGNLQTPRMAPLVAVGGRNLAISEDELDGHLGVVLEEVARRTASAEGSPRPGRVLLVPPDHTRLYSRAGLITGILYERLIERGHTVAVLPALGTHTEMSASDCRLLFGERVPYSAVHHHQWRTGLVRLGEISGSEMHVLSGGRFDEPVPIETDALLLENWDLVVSVGQVVPHEVIGMANFTKNIVIGLGGAPTIHRSHFLGAVCDMETIMGRANSPVRDLVDAAFDRFIVALVPTLWVLTVMEDTPEGVVQRGLFVGTGGSSDSGGVAYQQAASLAADCNIARVGAFTRVACWLDPAEFRTMWLGNKAIYRTRMAMADGGELIILAPGIERFGEDRAIDLLIRRHGYQGTPSTLSALTTDTELAASLSAAAHLIHGSSEGRFRIIYCTDPPNGGLTAAEVASVGYEWRSLPEELVRLGLSAFAVVGEADGAAGRTSAGGVAALDVAEVDVAAVDVAAVDAAVDVPSSGPRLDADGQPFTFIANPALGLWSKN